MGLPMKELSGGRSFESRRETGDEGLTCQSSEPGTRTLFQGKQVKDLCSQSLGLGTSWSEGRGWAPGPLGLRKERNGDPDAGI